LVDSYFKKRLLWDENVDTQKLQSMLRNNSWFLFQHNAVMHIFEIRHH